jgi:curved DNA-binding protein
MLRFQEVCVVAKRLELKTTESLGKNGGDTGDLYIRIKLLPHNRYTLDGNNLILTVPITSWEAALRH